MTELVTAKNSKEQSAFQKLWVQAERQKKKNARFRDALETLVLRVQTTVHPAERDAAIADIPLLHKLLTLGQRKSLLQWQRGELDQWIHELLRELQSFALIDPAILDDLARYDAFRMGITLDDDEMAPAEQLMEIVQREQAAYEAAASEKRFDSDERDVDELDSDEHETFDFNFDFDAEELEQESVSSSTPTITNQFFQRMFRTTAMKLHPDREPDPTMRKVKQGLMTDLLSARKRGDVMTVLELYQEYAGGQDAFSKADEKQLIAALEHQIRELQIEQEHIAQQSPMHQMVFERFYHTNKKKTDKAIAQHLAQVKRDKIESEQLAEEIRTLKTLKPRLEQRYDTRYTLPGFFLR